MLNREFFLCLTVPRFMRLTHSYSYSEQKEKFIREQEKAALDDEAKRLQAAKAKEHEDSLRALKNKKDEEARQTMMNAAAQSGLKVGEGNMDRREQIIGGGWGSRAGAASATPAAAAAPAVAAPAWGRSSSAAEPSDAKYTPPIAAGRPASAAAPAPMAGRWGSGSRPAEATGSPGGSWGRGAGDSSRDGPPARDGPRWGQSKPGDAPGAGGRTGGWGK